MRTTALIVSLTLSASLAGWLSAAAGQTNDRSAAVREGAVFPKDETSSLPVEGGSRITAQPQTALSPAEYKTDTGDQNGNSLGAFPVAAGSDIVGLANPFLDAQWTLDVGRIAALTLTNKHTDQTLRLETGHLPRIVLDDGRIVDLAALTPATPVHRKTTRFCAAFKDDASGLEIRWSAELDDAANYLIQTLQLTAGQDTKIKELVFVDAPIDGARQVGQVDGSVVVCGDVFLAVEHPLAKNTVDKDSHVRCALPRGNVLQGRADVALHVGVRRRRAGPVATRVPGLPGTTPGPSLSALPALQQLVPPEHRPAGQPHDRGRVPGDDRALRTRTDREARREDGRLRVGRRLGRLQLAVGLPQGLSRRLQESQGGRRQVRRGPGRVDVALGRLRRTETETDRLRQVARLRNQRATASPWPGRSTGPPFATSA